MEVYYDIDPADIRRGSGADLVKLKDRWDRAHRPSMSSTTFSHGVDRGAEQSIGWQSSEEPGHSAAVHREAKAMITALLDLVANYRVALTKICDEEGRVCDEYEVCTHRACQSSYHAYAIAECVIKDGNLEALTK